MNADLDAFVLPKVCSIMKESSSSSSFHCMVLVKANQFDAGSIVVTVMHSAKIFST